MKAKELQHREKPTADSFFVCVFVSDPQEWTDLNLFGQREQGKKQQPKNVLLADLTTQNYYKLFTIMFRQDICTYLSFHF